MRLKKAKLIKETLEVSFAERKEDGTNKTVTETHETPVHPDLKQSFENLRPHLGLLCGIINIKQIKKIETPPDDLVENFHVSGISIKTGDDEGVVISGHYINPLTKKAVILNTPFTRYTETEEGGYKFADDLVEKVERANKEVSAYLNDGKKADDPQGNLFPEGEVKQPQNRLPEDIESEDVQTENDPNQGDPEVWKDGQRPGTTPPAN